MSKFPTISAANQGQIINAILAGKKPSNAKKNDVLNKGIKN
jgi:hypothetical protein